MKNFFAKIGQSMRCWMTGRYGPDVYGMFLLIAAMVLNCSNMFFRNIFLYAAADALFLYEMYRMFSKNIVKRASENSNYLLFATKFRHWFMARKRAWKDRNHKYFICPHCGQIVRVPKGHGKIDVRCPNCHTTFERKS